MPRSTSAAIWSCTLALAAGWAAPPNVRAQDRVSPDKFTQAVLNDLQKVLNPKAVPRAEPNLPIGELPVLVIGRPAQGGGHEEDGPPPRPVAILTRDTLERMIFGSRASDSARRAALHALLEEKISALGWDPPPSESQKEALRLAGRGDIKYFFDRVEEVRALLEGNDRVGIALDDYRRLSQSLQPLRMASSRGPFDDGSLFDKALRTIRRREQDAGRGDR